jgi:hypothetical protein
MRYAESSSLDVRPTVCSITSNTRNFFGRSCQLQMVEEPAGNEENGTSVHRTGTGNDSPE